MSSKMAFKLVNLCRRFNSLAFADLATKKHCISFLSSKILNSYSPVQTCTFSVLSRLNIQNKASQSTKELDVPDDLYKRIVIELKGHDPEVINSYEKFAKLAANELDVNIAKISTPQRNISRYTQLKSVHIFKKHRVQYETRTHFRVLELKHLTGSTADTYLEYIQRNLPEGMAMKVTRSRLESIPKHIQEAMNETASIEASSS